MFAPLPYGVSLAGWYFIAIQVLLMWLSYRSRGQVARLKALPSRTRHFVTTMVMQVLYLSLSLLVARSYWVNFFPPRMPRPHEIAAGLGAALVLAFAMYPLWRKAVLSRSRRIHFFAPRGAKEKALWVGVSLAAGIGEEVTYRGMLFLLFWTLTGSPWIGAILSALLFAGGHAFQSRVSMVIIFGFALLFQALALWTGTLYVSMLGHAVYDVIAGFMYAKLARELGYVPDVPEASGAGTITRAPPAARAPVQKSYQPPVVAGRYTERLVAWYVVTGLTRKAGPNMYSSPISSAVASVLKSITSGRSIVPARCVTAPASEYT